MSGAFTLEQRERAMKLIANPPTGSDLARARNWGIDLRQLVDNLCLSPTERIVKLERRLALQEWRLQRRKKSSEARLKRREALPCGLRIRVEVALVARLAKPPEAAR